MTKLVSLCPTIVLDRQGHPIAYCVSTADRRSSLRMLAPDTLSLLSSLDMPAGGRLGGFYMYMDEQKPLVVGAGDNNLLRISHSWDAGGQWHPRIENRWDAQSGSSRPTVWVTFGTYAFRGCKPARQVLSSKRSAQRASVARRRVWASCVRFVA